jgi:hypothetical protein
MLAMAVTPLLRTKLHPPPGLLAVGTALGFVLFEVWLLLVAREVLRRAGRHADSPLR